MTPPGLRSLDGPRFWRILQQSQVRPGLMIVIEEISKILVRLRSLHTMTWSKQLAANGSDDPFDVSTLPRRAGSGQNFFDAHSLDLINEVPAEDPIAIPQQVARCGVPGKGLPELLDTPFCCGMCGHGEVENPPAVVS
jgi:hypothetical protein